MKKHRRNHYCTYLYGMAGYFLMEIWSLWQVQFLKTGLILEIGGQFSTLFWGSIFQPPDHQSLMFYYCIIGGSMSFVIFEYVIILSTFCFVLNFSANLSLISIATREPGLEACAALRPGLQRRTDTDLLRCVVFLSLVHSLSMW